MKKYYCGPYYFPKKLTKMLSFGVNESCKFHDMGYKDKNSPKILIDVTFFFSMIKESCISMARGCFGLIMSPLFFIFVLTFGIISWNKK